MESDAGAKMMTAVFPVLVCFALISRSRFVTEGRGGMLVVSGLTKIMQIILFPVNIDKFTGFFDKYLKTHGKDNEGVTDIISVGYENGFMRKMNNFSKFIE